MPSGKVKERSFTLVPEDWYTAKLLSVEERTVGAGTKLKWKWEIIDADEQELVGKWVWGDCWGDLDQSDTCVWRHWQEAHVDHPINLDDDVDTEDILNFMVYVKVRHRSYLPKGLDDVPDNYKWVAEVIDEPDGVQPLSADLDELRATYRAERGETQLPDDPPF